MAKIIQIIDVNSEGHQVRLDNGFLHTIAHGGQSPQVGDKLMEITAPVSDDARGFTTVPDGHEIADIEIVIDMAQIARDLLVPRLRYAFEHGRRDGACRFDIRPALNIGK